ncbi:MAG: GMC family oxidoreductase N-terminal domain-containing protein [Polyangiaceae bacterium]
MPTSPDALSSDSAADARKKFPDEDLPEGAVVDGDALTKDLVEQHDFVVIGSGAAGAVAAHTLAKAGFSVGIVEEGAWVKTREFKPEIAPTFQRLMREEGAQAIEGRSFIPLLQGRCVGGSTVVNSAIAWRTPEDVIDDWRERFGLGDVLTMKSLEPHFDAIEKDLHVSPVADAVLGGNNRRFIDEAHRRNYEAAPMRRYDAGCKGSGRCLQGCPNAAKQGMNVTYVPWALATGKARIYTSCRVERAIVKRDRAVGVFARAKNAKVTLRARFGVFVAASTIQTPGILRRSGVRSSHLGLHFQVHPGVGVGGRFDERVDMHFGATQGAESIHFRKMKRFKLETISMPPELASARIPGIGGELMERLAALKNTAVWAVQVRMRAEGSVSQTLFGRDKVVYTPTEDDMKIAREALALICEMLFTAGAREVWPGVFGVPSVITSPDQVRLVENGPLDPRAYSLIATHLFGAGRMGPDPRSSVVGLDFSTHDVKNLYVVDSSLFPTNLGVNPQHSIMGISRLAASRVAEAAAEKNASGTKAA